MRLCLQNENNKIILSECFYRSTLLSFFYVIMFAPCDINKKSESEKLSDFLLNRICENQTEEIHAKAC